jgi:UDP-2,3-diacylglucosamine pyrophosphatase LpxH
MQESTLATAAKKKYKLVISDLHLGKGRNLEGGGQNLLEEFYYGDKLIEFLNYYSSGEYRDAEVELIINGDFLNFIHLDYRGHFLTALTESICYEMLQSMVKGHWKVFQALKDFCAKPGFSLTYVVGNHDQAMLWPACREYLNSILQTHVKYKNIVYFFDGVHIEHGHMHEAANRIDPKRFFLKKNLPEPILNMPFGSYFFIEFVLKVKHQYPFIDKIRPFSKMVKWALVNETFMAVSTIFKAICYFIAQAFSQQRKKYWHFKKIFKIFFESAVFPDLSTSAHQILMDHRVHTVIFGHSHVYQYKQWSTGKEYFNTGTWTELTSLDAESLGKITKLTYVFIDYSESENRPRGRLKEWRGFHRIEEDVAVS